MWVNIEYHLLCVKNFLFYEEKYIENKKNVLYFINEDDRKKGGKVSYNNY